jgi:hypothetical protein
LLASFSCTWWITPTASAGYLTRSNTNILAATGCHGLGQLLLHSSTLRPSCGGIASSAPDSPTTTPGIRRWPKPSCTHSALITRATASRNGLDTPALHANLFIPMLHTKTTPLLAQVYHGRLGHNTTTMGECSGQKVEAQIALGSVRNVEISHCIRAWL